MHADEGGRVYADERGRMRKGQINLSLRSLRGVSEVSIFPRYL